MTAHLSETGLSFFSSAYTFRGHTRFSYGFTNPNSAGTLIAAIVPWLWYLEDTTKPDFSKGNLVALGAELVLLVALALTLSRGACCGLIAAYFVFFGTRSFRTWIYFISQRNLQRLLFFTLVAGISGLASRYQAILSGDGSVGNRLTLWKGGLILFEAKPLFGWGAGTSGWAYMQWLQDPQSLLYYGGMVNSYLHIAVEFGSPVLAIYLVLIWFPIIARYTENASSAPSGSRLDRTIAASAATLAISAVFSTLWIEPILSVISTTLFIYSFVRSKYRLKIMLRSLSFALTLIIACLACGYLLNQKAHLTTKLFRNQQIFSRKILPNTSVLLYPDALTMGPLYGKLIRKWFNQSRYANLEIADPSSTDQAKSAENIILSGPNAASLAKLPSFRTVVIFSPTVPPPSQMYKGKVALILPELDLFGVTQQWEVWGGKSGATVVDADGCGADLSSAVVSLLNRALQ